MSPGSADCWFTFLKLVGLFWPGVELLGVYCSIWIFILLKTPSKFTGFNFTGTFTVGYYWK